MKGSRNGGEWRKNKITTNVPAFWIGTFYGNASKAIIFGNTIIKQKEAHPNFKPFPLGYRNYTATEIEFGDNRFVGCEFGILTDSTKNTYSIK